MNKGKSLDLRLRNGRVKRSESCSVVFIFARNKEAEKREKNKKNNEWLEEDMENARCRGR